VAWYEITTNMSELPSPSNKRNQVTDDEQQLTSTYSDSAVRFLYNETNNNNDSSSLNDLDLARGLIQLLVENNFTLKSLLNTNSSELSKTLGIDEEVATLICKTAKGKKPQNKKFGGRM
jgi:hypothetical protein